MFACLRVNVHMWLSFTFHMGQYILLVSLKGVTSFSRICWDHIHQSVTLLALHSPLPALEVN